jgi:hypothetical protein
MWTVENNHFIELCLKLATKSYSLHDENFIRELLDIVKHNVLLSLTSLKSYVDTQMNLFIAI